MTDPLYWKAVKDEFKRGITEDERQKFYDKADELRLEAKLKRDLLMLTGTQTHAPLAAPADPPACTALVPYVGPVEPDVDSVVQVMSLVPRVLLVLEVIILEAMIV